MDVNDSPTKGLSQQGASVVFGHPDPCHSKEHPKVLVIIHKITAEHTFQTDNQLTSFSLV